ncbi:ParB N-terminal domain-containing protein [Gymnodinialimonas sp. 2305UL16-5]|uniref:ParB/RepB/Spo0J family partition protein n=1 Tax=Gymnodinialimonas mytili TaxID=3126503 RepID=UPI0030B7B149
MTRKKRMFDIEMPVEDAPAAEAPTPQRRGPMASAISENAEALQARKSAADAIRAENDALAHEYVALRDAGHIVRAVALEDVHCRMLVRDRLPGADMEMAELVTSIRDLGLSNPIRVMPRPDGDSYELVQGYRRLTAYRQLLDETGDAQWATIPALVLPGATDVAGLYRRMVDENVIRKDLSFAEMAYAAQNYAADPATGATDLSEAVAALFQSAPYSKRSYIRSFAFLLDTLGGALTYPAEIPRALGVELSRLLKEHPDVAEAVRRDLQALGSEPAIRDELDVLRRYAKADAFDVVPERAKAPKAAAGQGRAKAKTTFHIRSAHGQVKCTAGQGRLEIKVDRDFTSIDRARLEQAIATLVDGLS